MNGPTINGEPYDLVILIVRECDPFGRPTKCDVLYDDQNVTVEEGMQFITAFVKKKAVQPKLGGSA